MKTNWTIWGMFLLALLTYSCGDGKLDYRHKYLGDFEIQSKWVDSGLYPFEYELQFAGEVYATDNDRLVIRYDSVDALDVHVDRDGKLTSAQSISNFSGKFQDKNHFSCTAIYTSPFGERITFTATGTRTQD